MTATDPLHRLRRGWDRFWFAPAPPTNLGVCRALFFGALLLYFLRADYSVYGGAVSDLFWRPTWLFRRVLRFGPPREDVLRMLQAAWKVSLALGCVGLLTRVATVVAFALGLYLLGLPYNYGVTSHMTAAPVFVFGILALSRCGDAWSVDSFLVSRSKREAVASRAAGAGEYTWPVRLAWVLLSLVFFAAGVSKLRHSGISWVTSDTMQRLLLLAHHPVGPTTTPLAKWGLALARHPLLCHLMAAGTIVFEVGYPLALLGVRLRILFVTGMLLMLVSVRLLLGPPFELLMICHLFWLPWDRVLGVTGPGRHRPGR